MARRQSHQSQQPPMSTARNLRNTPQNPTTHIEEIEAAAKQNGLYTTGMLAKELGLNESTVRNRINKGGVKPTARIFPKGRGRFTWAYSKEVLEAIAEMVGEVRVEPV